jgi:hypothetical protein
MHAHLLIMHTANWQVMWQQGSSRGKGEPGPTLHACVPMSAVDCTNSQSNKMYFEKKKKQKNMNFIVDVALWQ